MIAVSGRDDAESTGAETGPPAGGRPVVFPVFDAWSARRFELALGFAAGAGSDLYVLDAATDRSAEEVRSLALDHREDAAEANRDVDIYGVTPGGDSVAAVTEIVERYGAGLLVLGEATPASLTDVVRGDVTERVPCDAVVVNKLRETPTVASILVPIADGPHSGVSVRVAGALARATDAWVELLHVGPSDQEAHAADLFRDASRHIPADVEVDTWHLEGEDVVEAIADQSPHYDLTVVGSPQKGPLRRFLFGSTTGEITSEAENTVLTTRRGDVRFLE